MNSPGQASASASASPSDAEASRAPGLRPTDQPAFYAALCYAAGIAFGAHHWRPALWWMLAATFFIACAAYLAPRRRLAAFVLALSSFALLGAMHIQENLQSEWRMPFAATPPSAAPDLARFTAGDSVEVIGHVTRASLLRPDDDDTRRQTLDLDTETIDGTAIRTGIRLNVYSLHDLDPPDAPQANGPALNSQLPALAAAPRYNYGDRLRFFAKLRPPHNYGDPGAMDYTGYLQQHGITTLASVRADRLELLPGRSGTRLGFLRYAMRRSIVEHLLALASPHPHSGWRRAFSLTEDEAGVLAAMIIGEQSLLGRDTKADFQRTGTFHILVVSGMNVGILAFVVFWLARRMRAGELAATLITIALTVLYASLTDLGTPILRAALMLSLYLAARLLYREGYSLNAIGAAALLVLLGAPGALFEAGFQLTFLSVVILTSVVQPLLETTISPFHRALHGLNFIGQDITLAPRVAQFRIELRMLASRLARILPVGSTERRARVAQFLLTFPLRTCFAAAALIITTSIIQAGLALPMVVYFHRMALLGLPANMAVVPLTAVLMPVGILAALASYGPAWLLKVPAACTALTLHAITFTVRGLGGLRFADFRLAMPGLALALISAFALFAAVMLARRSRAWAFTGATALLAAAALLFWPRAPQLHPGVAEVTAIDVGQGDSIFIASPQGKLLLIDGGGPAGFARADSFDTGEDVVSPYLWSRGIARLDVVALTHAHSDHIGGLRSILFNFRPRELWVGEDPPVASYTALLAEARSLGIAIVHHHAGDVFDFGGARIHVYAPPVGWQLATRPRNDDSLVLGLEYGATSALLSGDVEKRVEKIIAPGLPHFDLLKVAHHGSNTSTTPELLSAVQPEFAVVSAGFRNSYGHPKPAVLERLGEAHARTYRTDTTGAITFYLDGKSVVAKTAADSGN